jgi:hypothetical protein
VTVEKGPCDKYGLGHRVKGAAFEALKEAFGADGPSLAKAVRMCFSGEGGIKKFGEFCEANGIEKTTYLIR